MVKRKRLQHNTSHHLGDGEIACSTTQHPPSLFIEGGVGTDSRRTSRSFFGGAEIFGPGFANCVAHQLFSRYASAGISLRCNDFGVGRLAWSSEGRWRGRGQLWNFDRGGKFVTFVARQPPPPALKNIWGWRGADSLG